MTTLENKKKMSRVQYLELMGRITTGQQLIVKIEGNRSFIKLTKNSPVEITLSDDMEFINKFFNSPSLSDESQSNSVSVDFDVKSVANELGYDVEEFKLFSQRMELFHELSHALFTPIETPKQVDSARKVILNYVEDVRVETKLAELYPPIKNKLLLNNRMLLSNLNMDNIVDIVKTEPSKKNVAMLACAVAGRYAYGLSNKEPLSPAIRRIVEVTNDISKHPKYNFKNCSLKFTDEIYNLITGLDIDELEKEILHQQSPAGDGEWNDGQEPEGAEGETPAKSKTNSEIEKIKREIKNGMDDFVDDLKTYGVNLKNRDERNLENYHYINPSLVNQLYQNLKQIIGGKPSKQNIIDYDGHSLDMEGVIEYLSDPFIEVKMYEKAGKKERPDMHIVFAIDSSGSMSGSKIEHAKKGAINLSVACEKLGIKTCIMDFATDVKIQKSFDMPLIESNISALCAGGGTDISVAVLETTKLLSKDKIQPNTTCALIILSDGCDDSTRNIAKYLINNPHIQMYMIGIMENPKEYLNRVKKYGARCYGHAMIHNSEDIGRALLSFTRDFVNRCR